jgi:hypothetical protein
MAKCNRLLGKGVIAQQCELDANHEGPHVSHSLPTSVEERKRWEIDHDPDVAKKVMGEFTDPPQTFDELRGEEGKRVHPDERKRLQAEAAAEVEAAGGEVPEEFAVDEGSDLEAPSAAETVGEEVKSERPFPGSLADAVSPDPENLVSPEAIPRTPAHAVVAEGISILMNGTAELVATQNAAAKNLRLVMPYLMLSTELTEEESGALATAREVLRVTADALDGGTITGENINEALGEL